MKDVAPLPGTFMLTSIIGFLLSAYYVLPLSKTWGFAFCLVFVLMFVASFISMSRADAEEELALDSLAFHTSEQIKDAKKSRESRSKIKRMTKKQIKEYADENYGIELSTNDLKKDMIDQFFEEL